MTRSHKITWTSVLLPLVSVMILGGLLLTEPPCQDREPDLQGLRHTMVYTVQCQKLHSKSIGFQFLFKGQGGEAQLTHGQNTKKRDFQRIVVDDRHYRVLRF